MKVLVFAGLAALAACASEPAGPDAAAFQRLIASARPGAAPEVRDVRCDFIAEEGSEWRCRYQQKASDGKWVPLQTSVAINGDAWILIDGVADPDRPPAS